ncbi:MAG TPA: HlyD family efflux transporter periplasmic adaptor subunit [Bacteroidales bacterium]|nr:HlyD family efflux transporter periplasmic adaptor subunit [Bacteroidales bacterium]
MNIPNLDPDYCIEKQIFRHNRKNNAIYLTVAFAVFIALLSLPFIYVDIVVHGVGIVRPITEKVELKSPIAETIAQVIAQEGQSLNRGDTILMLNTATVDASLFNLRSLLANLSNQIADLQGLCSQKPTTFRNEKRQQEYFLFQRQKEELNHNIDVANSKLKRNEPLFRSRVIPQDEFENYRNEKQRVERELKTLCESQLGIWKSDLNELNRQQQESIANIRKLELERSHYTLTAPVHGTLEQFSGLYPGGQVYSGQPIGVISPDSTLIVECFLLPKDIGFVHTSMKVSVLVEAFDYNQWGKLSGRVSDISSDYVLLNETPFYKVKCHIERPFLTLRNGKKGLLRKGMTVQIRFLLNRRSLFHLIYEKMDDWANPQNK